MLFTIRLSTNILSSPAYIASLSASVKSKFNKIACSRAQCGRADLIRLARFFRETQKWKPRNKCRPVEDRLEDQGDAVGSLKCALSRAKVS